MDKRRAFVRGLWGKVDDSNRQLWRKKRVDENITALLRNPYNEPFITYVWGADNYYMLQDAGVKDLILVDKNYFQWDLIKFQYRHKLELLKLAMQDYDEIIHMDWDCLPQRPINNMDEFWASHYKKEAIQCNLYYYANVKCPWRKEDQRKCINGGYMYIRDSNIPTELIKVWDEYCTHRRNRFKQSMEPSTSKYLDDKNNGWIGLDNYYNRYEPDSCVLRYRSPYNDKKRPKPYFIHYAGLNKVKEVK
jgi:hypothetical protein